MTFSDIPIISFFQRVVDPLIVMGTLYLCSLLFVQRCDGYALILMILAFFISSSVYQMIEPYRNWRAGRMLAYTRDVVTGWMITVAILCLLGVVAGMGRHFDRRVLLAWFIATPVVMLASHLVSGLLGGRPADKGELRTAIIVGANDVGMKFASVMERNPNLFMRMVGYFDDRTADRHPSNMGHPVLGAMGDVAAYVRANQIKMIYISQPLSAQPRIRKLLEELQDTTASVYFLPDIYVFDLMQARFDNVGGMPVIAICETPFTGVDSVIKRLSDIVIGAVIQLMLLPIMLVIAIAVKLSSPGPVIFRQRRYGLYGEEIIVYKFRSMRVTEDGAKVTQATKNDARVTPIGAFLRRSSLDELPQFINVLQGRMSIVGPRPHAVAHNEQYRKLIKGYMLRHKVKPGITGWAQVNGMRGETETLDKMEARIRYDLDYVRKWSLWLDLWIIFRTVAVVLKRENAH
ncbi:undecaprenyl-phosphate glucose phosphotransferase [Duganella sp. PWIR1]